VWSKDDPFGTELAQVNLSDTRLDATGVAIGTDPCPYRLEYELSTAEDFVTAQLVVRTAGNGWRRALRLDRSSSGDWSCTTEQDGDLDRPPPGGSLAAVGGALDCDLGLSPLTNSMPVLRHRLHETSAQVNLLMAWVAVPELAVYPSAQRYSFVRHESGSSIVRFESLDADFNAEITFDEDGIVLDYPGIARLVAY
jgi:hypothetical protein